MPVIPAFERLRQETISSKPAWAISEDSEEREGGRERGKKGERNGREEREKGETEEGKKKQG